MNRFIVGPVEELPPGSRKIVRVAGREIGIFNVGGEFFALRNVCPHMGAPICRGRTRPYVSWDESAGTTPDQIAFHREGEILKCPWHLWEFDLRTGQSMHDETLQVRTYNVTQEGQTIVLYL
ncbi:MAG: Rieske (2Fe-2S) protein [Chloroflexota bacterium]